MGNVGLLSPRAVLSNDVQKHFKRAHVNKDVKELVSAWFEDGAPLGLTLDAFEIVLRLQGRAEPFFKTFDTDRNQKVDAFELLAAVVVLSCGTIDEKIDVIFPVFDFAGSGQLTFDELSIFVHSVYRGLKKVCGTAAIDDNSIVQVCQQMFDSYNLPYHSKVTKEQIRRWLRNDIEAAGFLDVYQNSIYFPDIDAWLSERKQLHESIFTQLGGTPANSTVSVENLLRSIEFRQSLNCTSEQTLAAFLATIAKASGGSIALDGFSRATRAWNVFSIADVAGDGIVDGKHLPFLLHAYISEQPAAEIVEKMRKNGCIEQDGRINRLAWIASVMQFC